jgi:hypothetical protein
MATGWARCWNPNGGLQNELRAQGHRFIVDPAIEVAHMNYSRVAPSLRLHHLAGRMFAASRRTGWGPARRVAFALASPLIFAKRLGQSVSEGLARRARRSSPALPPLVLYLAAALRAKRWAISWAPAGWEGSWRNWSIPAGAMCDPEEVDLQLKPSD